MRVVLITAVILSMTFTFGCKPASTSENDKGAGQTVGNIADKENSVVVAEYSGGEITKSQLENEISFLPDNLKRFAASNPQAKEQILRRYAGLLFVLREARDKGFFEKNREIIEKQRQNLMLNIFETVKTEALVSDYKVTEAQIKEEHSKTEQVKASHILTEKGEKGLQEIKKIRQKIDDDEMSFEEAAKEHSKCPSSERGGDLGTFGRGKMVREFETAAFSLEEGAISEPVETMFGWHIIKVEEKSLRPLEDVRDELVTKVRNTKKAELFKDWKDDLISDAEIVYDFNNSSKLATMNGKKLVTGEDIEREISAMPDYMKDHYNKPENQKTLVKNLAENEVLIANLDESVIPEVEKAKIQKSLDQLVYSLFMKEHMETNITVKEDEIKALLAANDKEYDAHFLYLATNVREQDEVEKIMNKIDSDLNADNFLDKAAEYSDDPQSKEGNKMGPFLPVESPELAEGVKGKGKNDITDWITLPSGMIKILITDVKKVTLEDARQRLENIIRKEKEQEMFTQLMDSLEEKYGLKVYPEKL